jgi:hypothetical protein
MNHIIITRSQIVINPSLLVLALVTIKPTTHLVNVLTPLLVLPKMANINYVAWDVGIPFISPLALDMWDPIPKSMLKFVPKFTREGSKTPPKHL